MLWIDPQISFFPSVSLWVCEQISCRTITSTILYRFWQNFACGSEMWSLHRLLFVAETGSSLSILEVFGFQFWQFSGSGGHIFQQISIYRENSAMPTLYSMVNETRNRNRILEMCKVWIWFRLGITSTILYRFWPNCACGSEMWSHRRLLFMRQTGSSLPILEVCGFRFRQFSGSGDHIFQQISTKSHSQIKLSNADFAFSGEWNRK